MKLRNINILRLFLVILCCTALGLIMFLLTAAGETAAYDDIHGHWAESVINKWAQKGLVAGYGNNTFRPDNSITRAEFIVLINRVYGFKDISFVHFTDLNMDDWFFYDIDRAVTAGYVGGYPDGTIKPNNPITRQEAASILARVFSLEEIEKNNLETDGAELLDSFLDRSAIGTWCENQVRMVVKNGFMGGYPDGTFRPKDVITRAEVVSVLDRAVGSLFNQPGTYGGKDEGNILTIVGNVVVNTGNITLRDMLITGNLYLTEGIGDGAVILDNVTVEGMVIAALDVKAIYQGKSNAAKVYKKRRGDRSAPVFISGYPRVTNISKNQMELLVKTNEAGKAYYVLLADGAEAPSPVQVRAGQDASGKSVDTNNKGELTLVANEEERVTITGLTPSTAYDLFVVAEDLRPNLQPSVTKLDVQSSTNDLAALLSLEINPENIDFNAGIFTYDNVVVPKGTTTVEVSFTAVEGATTNISSPQSVSIIDGTGSISIEVTAADGVSKNTYAINFVEALSNNAKLSDLKVDGETIPGFAPDTYDYNMVLSYGAALVPHVAATKMDPHAHVNVTPATALTPPNNVATVVVTAEDGITTKTYSITFIVAEPSADATLSDLRVNNVTVPGFDPNTFEYTINVPYGTPVGSAAVEVSATEKDPNAVVKTTQAPALPGAATVVITAQDGITTKTYTVHFNVLPNTDASLTALSVNPGSIVFDPETLTYDNVVVPYGTTEVTVTFTAAPQATTSVSSPQTVNIVGKTGTFSVEVTAGDGVAKNTYTINFIEALNPAKEITSFSFAAPAATGVINEADKKIAVTVPFGTDVTNLTPTIVHTGASIVPASGTPQDFTNPVVYTVTAEDGTTAQYTVTVTIAANTDASLTALSVNPGSIVFDPETLTYDNVVVPYGTTEVTVTFTAAPQATTSVSSPQTVNIVGKTGTFSVEVTAGDGVAKNTYTINFIEALNPAKEITSFSFAAPAATGVINEADKKIAVTVPFGTDVTNLTPTIVHTGASIVPASGTPQDFTNPVVYTVTAEDGTTAQYTVTVTIAANTDASLASLEVSAGTLNFAPGTLNYNVTVPHDTTSVTVTFTTAPQATASVSSPQTVTISGGTGYFEVLVTAGDGVNKKTYAINFTEAPDDDATLSDLKADGVTISGFAPNTFDYSYVVPYGTTVVPTVSATTNDPNANATTTQATAFTAPDNVATVLVRAEDGTTTKTYTVTITMAPPSTDATLSDLCVNNVTVSGFDPDTLTYSIDVPYGTTVGSDLVKVTAEKNDPKASMNIMQATVLPGAASVVVTAEDGIATKTYTVNFNVLPNTDASLISMSISPGELHFNPDVLTYDDVSVPFGTTTVEVTFTAAPQATTSLPSPQYVTISGKVGTFSVVVTAGDEVTKRTYTINFLEAPENDVALSDLRINGETIDGFDEERTSYDVVLPYGTTDVPEVTVITREPTATYQFITQATGFETPNNTTTFEVTADDGVTKAIYTITFTIAPPSTDATLSDLRVNNVTVPGFDPDTTSYTVDVPFGTEVGSAAAEVSATKNDPKATMNITQVTALPGAATVVVTAEDGITTNTYTVNFNVLPNTDASLTTLEISAGEFDFDPGTTYYEVTVPHDTTSVTVTFTAAPQATTNFNSPKVVTISGGEGTFAVQVTAGDGVTKKTYVIMFTELPDTDASLSDLSVNGETVSGFAPEVTSYSIELPYGTKVVPTVTVTTNDPNASYDITQATSFAAPNNVATVLVTAEDGTTTKTYTVTFTVAAPSTDATLSDLRVNNVTVPGFNPYITVYTIDVPYGTTPSSDLVKVTAEANHPNATVNINEATVLPGSTSVVVTAEDGTTTKTYTVYFNVLLNTAAEITSFSFVQQTSPAVIDSAVGTIDIEVAYGTNLTYLIATFELSDYATATVNSKTQISGSTPNNFTSPVTYVVRAAAGNTKDWLVTATVARSSNATISSEEYTVTLDGDSGTINNVPYNTSKNVFLENIRSADGSSQHWDTTGLSDPITDGDILIVTSEDGQTTVTYTIDVIPPSTDAALSDLRYDGSLVSGFDPDTTAYQIELPYGTTQVPTVTATVRDTGRATRAITQATGLTAPNNVARVVVTAEDGITERTYTVTFTVAKNDKAEITAFNLPYAVGPATINSAAGTIAIELGGSDSIDITNLVATFSLSEGATARVNGVLQISEVTANDFTNPVTYVVTAENGIVVKEWTITVTVRVNSITLEGIDGRLDVGLNCILPLVANIKPECASNKTLAWSVQNGTGEATIDQNGVLTGTKVGTVTVQATATDGSGVLSSVPVTIRDYYIAGVAWTPQSGTFELQRLGDGRGKAGGTDFDNLGPWKDMKLCMLSEHNGYIIGDEDFVTDDPYWPVMVKIPQFHYKRVYDPETGTNQFWISNDSKSGFTLHPAFTHRCGKGHDHTTEIYVGAYEAGLMECEYEECQDYDEELHLTSCSGQTPLVSKDMTDFRDYAENRTPGLWTLTDVMARDAIALLYMVEYANLDSQAVLGKGITELRYSTDDKVTVSTSYQNYLVVSSATAAHYRIGDYVGLGSTLGQGNRFASKRITNITDHIEGHKRIHVAGSSFSASVNDVLYHVAQLTGGCDDLNGASGSAGGDKTSGKSAVSYRGLENLWGNVNEFVDGINIDNYYHKQEARKPYVSNSMFWYWCNTFIVSEPCDEHGEDYYGYIPVGMTLPANSGWITNFAYAAGDDWLLMPSTTHSTDSSYIPDYYVEDWVNGEPRILAAGGDWFSGAGAGMFHRNVSPFYSDYYNDDQYVNIGARLMFLPFRDCTVYD